MYMEWAGVPSSLEVSGLLVGSPAFKAGGTGAPRPAGSIPVHLRQKGPERAARASDGQQIAGAGVGRGVAELGHGPGLDLADALPGEVEVLAHLLQGAGLAPVQA